MGRELPKGEPGAPDVAIDGGDMPKLVVNGAALKCDQGAAPAKLVVLPTLRGDIDGEPLATVIDHVPMTNIPSFGVCRTQSNPQVAAATAAANGVLTPQPCVPVTPSPWTPGSTLADLQGNSLLTSDCKCTCQWAGQIEITEPGTTVDVES